MTTGRLLLIDDEADIREVTQMSLEIDGWQVLVAASGPEGIATAMDEQPDAILLDVMMPGLDGPTTLRMLRADDRTSSIPVVFLTAKAQSGEQRQLHGLGASGVIAKPFEPETLGPTVRAMLGWSG